MWAVPCSASALLGQSDDVASRVCDEREGHPGRPLRFLHDPAAEFLGLFDDSGDVVHADEEGDQIGAALERAHGGVQRAGHTGVDEGVTGQGTSARVLPAEEAAEECPGRVRVFRPYLCVHDRVWYGNSRGNARGGSHRP
jgi:hypothetical protein